MRQFLIGGCIQKGYIGTKIIIHAMTYWFEVLAGFDNRADKYKKEGKNQQAPAVISLMYLTLGEDYPYNMAKNFKSVSSVYENRFSIMKYSGKLGVILKDMKDKKLLLALPDKKVRGRPRKYFKINLRIIQSPFVQSAKSVPFGHGEDDSIPAGLVEEFLDWMNASNSTEETRRSYLAEWSSIKEFDFVTFLIFLQKEAKNWESANQGIISELPNQELVEGKYKLSEHIENYIDMLSEEFKLNVMTKRGMFKSIKHFLDKPIPLHNFQDPRLPKK